MTTLTSPQDVMAAVPFLLGYQPVDSLVVISMKGDSIGMAMRIDYPEEIDPDQIDTFVSHLERESTESALIIAYVPAEIFDCDRLLDAITDALTVRNIQVKESIIIRHDRWRSRICNDRDCCPLEGNPLPEFKSSRIAAEQVADGNPLPFNNLSELIASISAQSTPPELLAALENLSPIDYEKDPQPDQQLGALAVSQFLKEFSDGGVIEPELTALVLIRLQDLQVRDFALGSITESTINSHWCAWRWLLTIAPVGYVAPVAALFAAISYERGDGVLAQRALDRAFADDPQYPLASLLRRVFTAGYPPEMFATMRNELQPKIAHTIFGKDLGVA